MIVRDFNKIVESERGRVVSDAEWSSVRMLLADDGMGFSFHVTFLNPGSEHTFEYKNHFESVYCMSGTGSTHEIRPGVMYALDAHDRHTLRAEEELVMACVFNPPVTGREVHREDGSYALEGS